MSVLPIAPKSSWSMHPKKILLLLMPAVVPRLRLRVGQANGHIAEYPLGSSGDELKLISYMLQGCWVESIERIIS